MSELAKAKLQKLKADGTPDGEAIDVQFNPSSLKLTVTNGNEGAKTLRRPEVQYTGSSSSVLTVELIFDTADEGGTGSPRSVREKTALVEEFVYPRSEGEKKQAPPRMGFHWGDLVMEGVVDSVSIDFEHFASNGYPLRARVGFSLKEQDSKYVQRAIGPGANGGTQPPLPGQSSLGAVGSFGAGLGAQAGIGLGASASFGLGAGVSAQVGFAIEGESAAEFAARVGVDPAAWRGLSIAGGASASLSLGAGAEVGFSASLNASAGIGVFAGAAAGASVSIETSFGLKAEAGISVVAGAGAGAQLQQGFSLAAAGGIGAAVEAVKIADSDAAVSKALASFSTAVPANRPGLLLQGNPAAPGTFTSGANRPSLPSQDRTPARISGLPSPSAGESAPPAPRRPVADPRATSFGFGVPLRATFGRTSLERNASLHGGVLLTQKTGQEDVPRTSDPTTPPWEALPAADSSRKAADAVTKHLRGKRRCDCGGPTALNKKRR